MPALILVTSFGSISQTEMRSLSSWHSHRCQAVI